MVSDPKRPTQNGTLWVDGRIRNWADVSVPLMSDAVVRSVSVFDGMRADQTHDGRLRLLGGRAHALRLLASARSLRLPMGYRSDEILRGCAEVARAELTATGMSIAYVRPMALLAKLTDESDPASLTIAAFGQDDRPPAPIRVQISALRRPDGDSMPPQIKAVANYQLSRLARMAAKAASFDDALLLNSHGRLAESAGAAVIIERDGRLITPPSWEGALPSITIDILERLAEALKIPFAREPVPLASIWASDGLALAGTLADLVEVSAVDDLEFSSGPALTALRAAYHDALDASKEAANPHIAQLQFAEF